jgi:short-subunit dehydrogenase
MFAKRNRDAPRGAGTVPPDRYTKMMLNAIAKNKGEIVIGTPQLRVLAQSMMIMPSLFERILRRVKSIRGPVGQ